MAGFVAWLGLDSPADNKECGGYVLGELKGGRRRADCVVSRSAITLDADTALSSLPLDAYLTLGCALVAHTTWSHTPAAPRYRLVVPLSEPVSADEYRLIAEALMAELGVEQFDPGSAQPERLMYLPSDQGHYERHVFDGPALGVDEWLAGAVEAERNEPPSTMGDPPQAGLLDRYAASAIHVELRRLQDCELADSDAPWNNTTYDVACNLIEFANSPWSGYSLEEAKQNLLDCAPTDPGFGPREHLARWRSALKKVGNNSRPDPNGSPEADFAGTEEPSVPSLDDLFDATPILEQVRQAAHSRMVGAPALLCYVLGRVLAEVPPEVQLPPVIGGKASLNLGIAVVGGSGAGKSALLSVSRELLGLTGTFQEDMERSIGSGEGLVQQFLRWDASLKESRLIDDPRRLMLVDEVDQLGATKNRNGATIAPVIRSALTGGPLGQANATAERNRNVRAGTYRLVLVLGVQPTRSDTLLEDADAGTPQRLVWVQAIDPTLPDEDVAWPGPLHWDIPQHLPAVIDYGEHIKDKVKAVRRAQIRDGVGALEGHQQLTRLKVAAALALLHGDTFIADRWWDLAGRVIDASIAAQAECKRVLGEELADRRRTAGRLDGIRLEGTAQYRDERTAKAAAAIWRKVANHAAGTKDGNDQKHEPEDGCTARCVSRALRDYADRNDLRDGALAHAVESEWVLEDGDRLRPGPSRPA